MLPFLIPIVSMLADKGLDLLSGAIEGGADKAIDFVSEKTGIDLNSKQKLTSEEISKLRVLENTNKIELEKLALLNKKEDNRHDEFYIDKRTEDSQSARDMFKHGSELQTETAREIMSQTKWQIPLYMSMNLALIVGVELFELNATIGIAAGNLIGLAIAKSYQEREQINSFLFGAMIAKVKKKEDS